MNTEVNIDIDCRYSLLNLIHKTHNMITHVWYGKTNLPKLKPSPKHLFKTHFMTEKQIVGLPIGAV